MCTQAPRYYGAFDGRMRGEALRVQLPPYRAVFGRARVCLLRGRRIDKVGAQAFALAHGIHANPHADAHLVNSPTRVGMYGATGISQRKSVMNGCVRLCAQAHIYLHRPSPYVYTHDGHSSGAPFEEGNGFAEERVGRQLGYIINDPATWKMLLKQLCFHTV